MAIRIPDNNEITEARKIFVDKYKQCEIAKSEKAFYEIDLVEKILSQVMDDFKNQTHSFPEENLEAIEKYIRKIHLTTIKLCKHIGYPITWDSDFYRFPKGENNGEEK